MADGESAKTKDEPGSTKAREKKSSRRSGSATLEEIKRRGRQLRSAQKDGGIVGLYGGFTIEHFSNQPTEVGLVYDEQMLEHHCTWDKDYPEEPERLAQCIERCCHYGLIDRCERIPSCKAEEEEVLRYHTRELLEEMKQSSHMNESQLKVLSSKYDGVFFHQSTYDCSMVALGSTIELVNRICDKEIRHGMAIIRPPGHHAMSNEVCGYCFFNNVTIAAKHALENHRLKRILIVDWDVHHGQGTQYAFYNDPRVIYFSIHRYEHGRFWPNLRESGHDMIGEDSGRGFNINVPLNKTEMTNGDYLAIFTQLLLPIAYEFNPQLVLVSAGYDCAIGCPEGRNLVTPAMFAHFVNLLKPLANGRLALILEGGYNLKSLSESVAMSLRALLGDPCPEVGPLEMPSESIVSSLLHVIHELRPYWRSLAFQGVSEEEPEVWSRHKPPEDVVFSTEENRPESFCIEGDYEMHTKEKEVEWNIEIDKVIASTNLSFAPNRTCIVYDENMRNHKCTSMGGHPERPDRIKAIYEKHVECGFVDRCRRLESRYATDAELLLVHNAEYLETVKGYRDTPIDTLHSMEVLLSSVYLSQEAYECASLATGSTLQLVDEVCTGKSQNGVAIIRPPGHHAEPHVACGFCYFNTVAVAARYAQQKHNVKRVLILDWDVHHGNGTQHMFWDDPSVLYVSLHRHDNGFFFPGGQDGDHYNIGEGPGKGFNVNIPWNTKCGDAEYIAAFQQIVLPIAYEFAPDLVIISAGFDAAKGDPLGGFKVTPEGYAHMTCMLMGLAGGRVIIALEGGYNLHSISESMLMCTSMLLGDICPPLNHHVLVPTVGGAQTICNVIHSQSPYWKSLQFGVDLPMTAEQKEVLMAAGDIALEKMGVAGIGDTLDGVAVSPLPTADQVYGSESSSSEDSLSPPAPDANPSESAATGDCPTMAPDSVGQSEPEGAEAASVAGAASPEEALGAVGGVSVGTISASEMLGETVDGEEQVEMFAVVPKAWCPHLDEGVAPLPPLGLDARDKCQECQHSGECWVCLRCYEVHCGRYINEHMLMHALEIEHQLVLSYADLSVWCYPCESYIHHPSLQPAKRAAHFSKFGKEPGDV